MDPPTREELLTMIFDSALVSGAAVCLYIGYLTGG